MLETANPWWKRLLLIPPLALGVILLLIQMRGREAPEQAPPAELVRAVRTITAERTPFVPRAVGYGQVQPGTVWNAVAQVGGRVIERHPDLEPGKLLDAGTVLFRIDPVDYELAVARFEAQIESVRAELAELAVEDANRQASLEIERRSVALTEAELERKRILRARGNASQATVDETERMVLSQRQQVQDLENALRLIPVRRQVLEASLALSQAQLEDARLDLARTTIRMPFEGRIASVSAEENQVVGTNEVLAVADSIDVAEVVAQVPIEQVQGLIDDDVVVEGLSAAEMGRLAGDLFGGAVVRLRTGPVVADWRGLVDRISPAIDPQTRTVGVVVAVAEPYRQAVPGRRPPLVKNMYVQVEVFGHARPGSLIVPRTAVHRGPAGRFVRVAGADDRLAIIPVELGSVQGDLAVISGGLEAGARVVVTDLIPAIAGMKLAPREDAALMAELRRQAAGPGEPQALAAEQ